LASGPSTLVLLLLQRLALDLELHDAPVELIERLGLRVDLHAQARRRLVDEVDRLVGQEAVGDVAVGQHGGGDERASEMRTPVVHLVFLLEPAQDRDGVLDRRLGTKTGWKRLGERCVLLHMLAVFVEVVAPTQ
jgi:hypothetical protein